MFKSIMPPFLYSLYQKFRKKYGYFGEYKSWEAARSKASGYDDGEIIEKVKNAALKVKNGEAAYERDSVLFEQAEPTPHLLAPLLWIASKNNNKLEVLDFGGALGTTYYQNKEYLNHLDLKWSIIEQPKFVEYGKNLFEDETLRFYGDLNDYKSKPDVVLLGSVLQYLESPYQVLEKIIQMEPKYILIDKTPFLKNSGDTITVQRVPPKIYDASYPSWIFDLNKMLDFMKIHKYNLLYEVSSQNIEMYNFGEKQVSWKGFLFEKNE